MNPFARLSTRWKLILACTLVEVLMLAVLLWNGLRLIEESLGRQAETRIQEISTLLNASIAPALAKRNYGPLNSIFTTSRSQDGIQYFALIDSQGHTLISDGWDADTPLPSPQATLNLNSDHGRIDRRIPLTLGETEVGHLQFGISTAFVHQARAHLIRQSLVIGFFATVLSALALALLALWLTRHLQRLTAASRAVAHGEAAVVVPVSSADEIGQLATAFNTMAGQIQKQMDALRQSEERYRKLLELSADWYWEQDAHFRFTRFESGQNAHGKQPPNSHLIGHPRWHLPTTLTPEEWANHQAILEAHQVFRNLEYGISQPDGSIRYFISNGEPVFGDSGDFQGYRGTTKDVTDFKQAEVSLRLAASVFAEAQEAIIIADAKRRIIDANPAYTWVTGYAKDAILNRHLDELHIEEVTGAHVDEIWRSLDTRGLWRGEVLSRRQDGTPLAELVNMMAVRDEYGEVSHHIVIFSDITPLKEQQRNLERLAHYDALTQLPNRVLLADRLDQGIAQALRDKHVLAVAYLDLDGFKPVNDTLGHAAGDLVLKEVAHRLRGCVRAGDTVARLGGDEFVLLIRAEDFGECEAALLRVLDRLAEPYNILGHNPDLSASIGVTLSPHDPADPDGLLRHADHAMYVAKQSGKNRYHLFDASHEQQQRDKWEHVSRIQSALLNNEFALHYQPKVNMANGEVIGAEALIRWQHPERGLLLPDAFLPAIIESEFIVTLGNWVIASALAQMATWQEHGLHLPVSVNLAPRQCLDPNFVSHLRQMLAKQTTVSAHRLELEIIESAALNDVQAVSAIVDECRKLGVSFALDDFGTGYSSLTYLRRLPVQVLKIDRSFVRDMLNNHEDHAVVAGIIGLAQAFDREIIAEGVESAAHGRALMELGCFHAQGYAIAPAMPASAIPEWVERYRRAPLWNQ